ncbi:MAG: hypothetical protein KatS3mg115_0387 [Candidatus Poribacteria bacterium]|nr:MAG: hypothetical protein KatS3mg115_0387 [Candidatus Poribacteria bacterium]
MDKRRAGLLPRGAHWLVGSVLTFPAGRATDVLRELKAWSRTRGEDPTPRYLLQGDSFHADQLYDITDRIEAALSAPVAPEAIGVAERLRGRTVLRLERREEPLPLFEDLEPTFPSAGELELSPERFPEPTFRRLPLLFDLEWESAIGWWFLDGEPSRQVRGRLFRQLRDAVREEIARVAQRRSVRFRWPQGSHPWWMGPRQLLAAGAQVVVPTTWGDPSSLLLFAESLADWVSSERVFFSSGGGFPDSLSVLAPGTTLRLLADCAFVLPREDWWAHFWDRQAWHDWEAAQAAAELLAESALLPRVLDEEALAHWKAPFGFRAVVLSPCRSLSSGALDTLEALHRSGTRLILLEPAPETEEGERSERLRRLYTRRRVELVAPEREEFAERLRALLRRSGVRPVARAFRRGDGSPARALTVPIQTAEGWELLFLWSWEEGEAQLLVEWEGVRRVERWEGEAWKSWDYRWANARTYWDWKAGADAWGLFRLRPVVVREIA